jgi:hypothetical protein
VRGYSWIQLLRTDRRTYSCGLHNKTTDQIKGGISFDQFGQGRLTKKGPTSYIGAIPYIATESSNVSWQVHCTSRLSDVVRHAASG